MYKIGDEFNIKVKIDNDTILDQTLIISFAFDNIIITCGHCLPSNSIITNGKILYTSGYQTNSDSESEEIGFIQLNDPNINLRPNYNLLRPKSFEIFRQISKLSINKPQIQLINRSKYYDLKLIKLFNYDSFNQLKFNQINQTDDIYWLHAINRIIENPYKTKSKLSTLFDMSFIGIAYPVNSISNQSVLSINDAGLTKSKLEKEFGYKIITNEFHSITRPSFSGSPIIYKNDFIGYHLGSTMAYKLNSSNQIYWLGKVIYFKMMSLVYG
jgi:hypothetical protein